MQAEIYHTWLSGQNRLMQAVVAYATELVRDAWQIESPEQFVDMLTDWLGENAANYRRCRTQTVTIVYKTDTLLGETIRIFYDTGTTLTPVMVIFCGEEPTITN